MLYTPLLERWLSADIFVFKEKELARCVHRLFSICKQCNLSSPKLISLQWQLNSPSDISKLTVSGRHWRDIGIRFLRQKKNADLGINIKEHKLVWVWLLELFFLRSELPKFRQWHLKTVLQKYISLATAISLYWCSLVFLQHFTASRCLSSIYFSHKTPWSRSLTVLHNLWITSCFHYFYC